MEETLDGGAAPKRSLRNIEEVVRLEEEAQRNRPPFSRIADAVAGFAGNPGVLLAHAAAIAGWAAVNLEQVPGLPAFDPYPFGLLGGMFSLEEALLAACVLVKQNRMSARAEERSHLDLQISLLAEQEVTKVIQMLERISARLGVEEKVADPEAEEPGQTTAVGGLACQLQDRLPEGR